MLQLQSRIFTLHRTFSAQCRKWQNTCTRVKGVIMLAFNLYLSCSCLLSLCKPARTNSTAHNQLFRTMEKAFWTNSHRAHISWIWIFHHCPGDVKEVGQGARSPRGSHLWNFAQFINTSCSRSRFSFLILSIARTKREAAPNEMTAGHGLTLEDVYLWARLRCIFLDSVIDTRRLSLFAVVQPLNW